MKIYVYPADEAGCGYYRMIWPARAVKKLGHDVKIVMPKENRNITCETFNDQIMKVNFPADADVIVLQRVTHRYLADAIPIIRQQGTAVVIDMDDDLSTIHPRNPAWAVLHPRTGHPGTVNADHNWGHAIRACRAASMVTLSADALAPRYASGDRYRVLRNCVPESYLNVPHTDSDIVGWGGSLASHPDDLNQVGMTLTRLQRDGFEFKVVGHPGGIRETLKLDDEPTTSGIVNIAEWPSALTTLGVGIAPLADTQFNKSKSWLKPLEYAAVGVPIVMSRRLEYERFHAMSGVGFFADKPNDWYRLVKMLLHSPDVRAAQAALGREAVVKWTYERQAEAWAEAWLAAAEIG